MTFPDHFDVQVFYNFPGMWESCQQESEYGDWSLNMSARVWTCQQESEHVSGSLNMSMGVWMCQYESEHVTRSLKYQ